MTKKAQGCSRSRSDARPSMLSGRSESPTSAAASRARTSSGSVMNWTVPVADRRRPGDKDPGRRLTFGDSIIFPVLSPGSARSRSVATGTLDGCIRRIGGGVGTPRKCKAMLVIEIHNHWVPGSSPGLSSSGPVLSAAHQSWSVVSVVYMSCVSPRGITRYPT